MKQYDVIIAGGGPAGSTAATLLAQYGYQVLLLEQGIHPRFHIGESMMPYIEPVMQRLGVDWGIGNLRKSGADFIHEASGRRLFFSLQGKFKTYQIERSVFDEKLFKHAIEQGVEAHQQEKVTQLDCHAEAVSVQTPLASYQGRYFIDATGRSALTGRKHQGIQRLGNLGRFALYQHYQLNENSAVIELFASGNVQILLVDIGWLWVIPLTGQRLSVGLVVQKNSAMTVKGEALFQQYRDASPLLMQLLENAVSLNSVQTEADFSYINQRRYGQRFACCGDAAGFLDPVFSSGFFFAVKTAELIADRLHQGFLEGRENDPGLQQAGDAVYKTGFNTMHLFIDRFYRSHLIDNLIFEFERHERIKNEIAALLAGDLWDSGNLFQQGLLNGRRSKSLPGL